MNTFCYEKNTHNLQAWVGYKEPTEDPTCPRASRTLGGTVGMGARSHARQESGGPCWSPEHRRSASGHTVRPRAGPQWTEF